MNLVLCLLEYAEFIMFDSRIILVFRTKYGLVPRSALMQIHLYFWSMFSILLINYYVIIVCMHVKINEMALFWIWIAKTVNSRVFFDIQVVA